MSDLDKFFAGRSKALKFETIGTSHELHITGEVTMEQQTDFDTGAPLSWPDGTPKMQALIPGRIETGLAGPSDDGERTLYVKGYMQNAVSKALREAGVRIPEPGGVLTITYSYNGEKKGRGQAPKMYTARYVPPTKAKADDFFAGGGGSTQHEDIPAQRARVRAGAATSDDSDAPF